MAVVSDDFLAGIVRTRLSNLVITGNRGNHGNYAIWRRYAVRTATALGLQRVLDELDSFQAAATADAPLELSGDEDDGVEANSSVPSSSLASSSSSSYLVSSSADPAACFELSLFEIKD